MSATPATDRARQPSYRQKHVEQRERVRLCSSQKEPVNGLDTEHNLRRLHPRVSLSDDENHEEQYQDQAPKAWLYPELPWGAPPEWDKKNMPGARFLAFFEMGSFVCCLYVAVSVPYLLGFNSVSNFSAGCIFVDTDTSTLKMALSVLNVVVDIVFTLDIILQFHTARWVLSTVGTPHWVLVEDLAQIRRMYFYGFFFQDFVGQIPWQYLDCVFPNMNAYLKMLRLLRLLKLFRLYRVRHVIQKLYRKFPKSELLVTAFELILTLCIFAHWMSCLWFSVGYEEDTHDGWLVQQGMVDENGAWLHSRYHEWVTAFYWAITTMSTIGYGDISAITTSERTVASVVMVLGCGFFAWATGRLTHILTKTHICTDKFNSKLEEMNEYMEARAIRSDLVERAKSFYMLKYPTLRIFNEESILQDLPVEIRKEVQLEIFQDIIAHAPMFNLCSRKIQKELCYRLKSIYFEAGAMIMEEGTVPDALYVVRFGFVNVSSGGTDVLVAKRGDVIGENALVGLNEIKRRKRSAHAQTECELCALSKESLEDLLVEHPEMQNLLTKFVWMKIRDLEVSVSIGQPITLTDVTCIDWKKYAAVLREDMQEYMQQEHPETVPSSPSAKKFLTTKMWILLREIEAVSPCDTGTSCRMFCVATWHAEHGEEPTRAESKVFEQPANAQAWVLDVDLQMQLRHETNNWKGMPDLQLQLYRLPSQIAASSIGGTYRTELLAHKSMEGKLAARLSIGAMADAKGPYKRCTKLWEGSVSMKTLVSSRATVGSGSPDLVIDLKPSGARTSGAKLIVGVEVERIARPNSVDLPTTSRFVLLGSTGTVNCR